MSDPNKPRLSLVPLAGLDRIAHILEAGIRPEDGRQENDWQKMTKKHFVDARLRHIRLQQLGDETEDHQAAIAANDLIILWFEEMGAE